MGYEAVYNDENDHVIITYKGEVLRDDHVMEYTFMKEAKSYFEETHPGEEFSMDPKEALRFKQPPIGHLEYVQILLHQYAAHSKEA